MFIDLVFLIFWDTIIKTKMYIAKYFYKKIVVQYLHYQLTFNTFSTHFSPKYLLDERFYDNKRQFYLERSGKIWITELLNQIWLWVSRLLEVFHSKNPIEIFLRVSVIFFKSSFNANYYHNMICFKHPVCFTLYGLPCTNSLCLQTKRMTTLHTNEKKELYKKENR